MARRGTPVRAHLGRVEHGAGHLPALVFPAALRRLYLAVIGSIVLALVGVALLVVARDSQRGLIAGVLVVDVFGTFAIIGAWGLIREVGSVALTAAGIHGGARSEVFVPWPALVEAVPLRIHHTSMVGLRVSDPAAIRMPRRMRLVERLNVVSFGVDVAVGGPTDAARAEFLARAIAYYAEDVDRRVTIGLSLPPLDGLVAASRKPGAERC